MKKHRTCWVLPALCGLLVSVAQPILAAEPQTKKLDPKEVEFFEKKIRPVLVKYCYECHSAKSKEDNGELLLDSRANTRKGGESGPAVVPGKVKGSLLIDAIRYGDLFQMPPDSKLPAEVIADFVKWVEMGAPDPRDGKATTVKKDAPIDLVEARKFWAFQRPVKSPLPTVKNPAWCDSPIDYFILAELEAAGLQPAPQADRRTLVRRATYDLTGLPPTPKEVKAFIDDDRPDAYEKLIDRLLASPRYGERWGRHWLDVARYADSNGLDENLAYSYAFRYRDWVIDALNEDLPYDRFIHQQLAGDLISPREGETERQHQRRLIATGFLSLGPKMLACDDGRKMEMDIIDEQLDTTSRALMAITMGCARCHAHKFDPFPAEDYYSLAGIFKSTKTMENFRVVAVWHEYELATAEQKKRIKQQTQKLKLTDLLIKNRTTKANEEFLNTQRALAGKYLTAAAKFVRFGGPAIADGRTPIGQFVEAKDLAGRGLLWEAEKFERGTLTVDKTNWGKGIGVLLQAGFAEYDIDLPQAGKYQLELRYAALESRPVELSVNGRLVKKDAAGKTTGSWSVDRQRWHLEGVYEFTAGKNVLRLQRGAAVPHIDKILLVKVVDTTDPATLKPRLTLGSENDTPGAILVEAEKFNRGTFGRRGPIIQNLGDGKFINRAEYDIEILADGNYQLDLLYASGASRPVRLSINGQLANAKAATQTSGGFGNDQVRWFAEGVFAFKKGNNTIRLEVTGPTPHFDQLALLPTKLAPTVVLLDGVTTSESPEQVAQRKKLNLEVLRQWIGYLQGVGRSSVFADLVGGTEKNREQLIAQHAKQLDQAEADPRLKAYRAVLYDKSGPIRLPNEPQRFFSPTAQGDLARLKKEKTGLEKNMPQPARAMGVREGKVENLKVHIRGNYLTLGQETPRRFPQVISGADQQPLDESVSGRLQLAHWFTSPTHPLTARVMANRIWHWHFGEGIVRTVDNFGNLGQRPTNQKLLDWLAVRFVESQWSIKALHRRIMLSSTYRMSTQQNDAASEKDPENRLWWRFNRRRLEAEAIRDTILALGDDLDLTMHGQLMPDKNRAYVTGTGSKQGNFDFKRRSVYLPVLRSAVYPVLQAFDFPDPAVSIGHRPSTTVAPQALFMMNDKLVLESTRRFAQRLLADGQQSDADRVETAYRSAFGRVPTSEEINRSLSFLKRYQAALEADNINRDALPLRAWQGFCRVLIASSELIYID